MRRHQLLSLWLLLAVGLPAIVPLGDLRPAHAEGPPPLSVAPEMPTNQALAQLFKNVDFWARANQPQIAMQELERALALSPHDADILVMATKLALQLGWYDAADSYRNRLRENAPNDPRLAILPADPRRTPSELRVLEEARKLSSAGRKDAAIKLYRQLPRGKVPDSLTIEYYMVLGSSSPEGFIQASNELTHEIERWPSDVRLKLAYAQLQTFQEGTRAAGIEQLQELSHNPLVEQAARNAWRDALSWQGPDFQVRDQIEAYLHDYPDDPIIKAKRDEVRASLPDEGVLARMRGYEASVAGRLAEAEREFLAALAFNPDDAEAMIVLAVIRRQQKRFGEATKLIDRAFELAPDRRDEFRVTLGDVVQSDDSAAKAVREQYAQVTRLTNRGEYDKAEQLLKQLIRSDRTSGGYFVLGNIQVRTGRLTDAEASFRRAMQMNPRNADAVAGLADVLSRQGRIEEGDALYIQAHELYAKSGNRSGLRTLNRSRAEQLRSRAARLDDPSAQIGLYRAALTFDPSHAWLRLDLARALQKQGHLSEARQIMTEITNQDHPSIESLQAAIIFAQQVDDLRLASRLIDRLPARERTPQMREMQEQTLVREEIQRIVATGNPAMMRSRLVALAARPDPTGARGSEIGRTLVRLKDNAAVRSAIGAALVSTPSPTVQQRLAYSGTFLAAGLTQDAQKVVEGVDRQNLPAPLRRTLNQVQAGIAVQQSDKLNEQGHTADAFDTLAPRLAMDPENASLNLALSRLYQANGKPRESKAITETMLQRDPNNLDVRLAAVNSAIAQGDYNLADRLVKEGLAMLPNDPRVYVMSANLAKAKGRNGQAMADLQKARELRERQLLSQE